MHRNDVLVFEHRYLGQPEVHSVLSLGQLTRCNRVGLLNFRGNSSLCSRGKKNKSDGSDNDITYNSLMIIEILLLLLLLLLLLK